MMSPPPPPSPRHSNGLMMTIFLNARTTTLANIHPYYTYILIFEAKRPSSLFFFIFFFRLLSRIFTLIEHFIGCRVCKLRKSFVLTHIREHILIILRLPWLILFTLNCVLSVFTSSNSTNFVYFSAKPLTN